MAKENTIKLNEKTNISLPLVLELTLLGAMITLIVSGTRWMSGMEFRVDQNEISIEQEKNIRISEDVRLEESISKNTSSIEELITNQVAIIEIKNDVKWIIKSMEEE